MVYFYQGNTLAAITSKILSAIPSHPTHRHIIIAPDRFTLAEEEALLASRGALLQVEVLPFSQLAMAVCANAGCLTPEGCNMLLAEALRGCENQLVYYKKASRLDGFVSDMYASIAAIRTSGYSSVDLRKAAESMPRRAADKTRDIALLYEAYLDMLSKGHIDPATRLENLAESIPHCDWIADTCFYVVDFYCFNAIQYKVIKALMQYAKEVHIGYIASDVGMDNRHIYPDDLRTQLLACSAGIFVNSVTDAYEELPPYKQVIEESIFGYREDESGETIRLARETAPSFGRLFMAVSREEEATAVAIEIAQLVRDGYRYRDIAVVSADPDLYAVELAHVFASYRIPIHSDHKVYLTGEPAVRFLLDSMRCVLDRCERDRIAALSKNAFLGLPADEVDIFENYCLKYNINYTRFASPFTFADRNDNLEIAEKVRMEVVSCLPELPDSGKVHDYVELLRNLMADAHYDERFVAFWTAQMAGDYLEGVARSKQVPAKLLSTLATLDELLGGTETSAEEFYLLFKNALESVRIGLLPVSCDSVYFGEAKDSHYSHCKVLFVVGASDGDLPQEPKAGDILSDHYHQQLQNHDIVIFPSRLAEGRYARFYLEQILLLPSDRLYVSYIARNKEGEARPSRLLEGLSNMWKLPITTGLGHTLTQRVANRTNAYKVLLSPLTAEEKQAVEAVLDAEHAARYRALQSTPDSGLSTGDGIFFTRDSTSITQLETYFSCPYKHFVKYGLGAVERDQPDLKANETGTMLHEALELLFTRYGARIDSMSEEDISVAIDECVAEALDNERFHALSQSEQRIAVERLRKEGQYVLHMEATNVRTSRFKPVACEAEFKKGSIYPPIDLCEGVSLKGAIDRIDKLGNQITVVDYKSGADHMALQYLYYGQKIQLYAYLGVLQGMGYEPVGAFYRPVTSAYQTEKSDVPRTVYKGQVINEEQVILDIDPTLEESDESRLLLVKRDKGAFKAISKEAKSVLVTREQLAWLIQYTKDLMRQAVSEIKQGIIVPSPAYQACKYCQCYTMCPQGKSTPVRKCNAVSIEQFCTADSATDEDKIEMPADADMPASGSAKEE